MALLLDAFVAGSTIPDVAVTACGADVA
eukprot:COSAG01_NODE_39888_length_470_cov_17.040431_2_plen_27_part_01